MKRLFPFVALILCSAPAHAASTAITRVSLTIPVACSIDVVGEHVSAKRLTVTLHRRCNSWHAVTVENPGFAGKPLAMRFNDRPVMLSDGSARLPQDERWVDGVDTLVIDMGASAKDAERFARNLRVTIEQS